MAKPEQAVSQFFGTVMFKVGDRSVLDNLTLALSRLIFWYEGDISVDVEEYMDQIGISSRVKEQELIREYKSVPRSRPGVATLKYTLAMTKASAKAVVD